MGTLFLFGAGASFGSGACRPNPPPLGRGPDGLFRRLQRVRGTVASTITGDDAQRFEENFEAGMEAFHASNGGRLTLPFMRETAIFLLEHHPLPRNAYVQLLSGIRQRNDAATFASLNYDMLLEDSAAIAGYAGVIYTMSPLPKGTLRVLKPHGSANIIINPDQMRFAGFEFIMNSAACAVDGEAKPLTGREALAYLREPGQSLAPIMALYAPSKLPVIGKTALEQGQRFWADSVKSASRIFLVGVSLQEHDAHIWDPLSGSDASLFVVDPYPDQILEWSKRRRRAAATHLAREFAHEGVERILKVMDQRR